MMRNLAFLLAPSMVPSSLSCMKQDCSTPCPTAAFTSRLLSGTATFAAVGRGEATFRVAEGCNTEFKFIHTAEGRLLHDSVRVLQCTSGGNSIAIDLNTVVDAPSLVAGKHMWSAEAAGLEVLGPSQICATTVTGGTVTIDVTRQEGNVVAYPELVTSDYLRRYNVHVELSGNNASCGGISAIADLEVEQTAKDVVARPETVCYCL